MTATRIWALGTAVVIVAVLALGYLLGVAPMLSRLALAEQELAGTVATNQAQSATLQVMKAQYEDLESLQSDLEVLRVSIPGVVDTDFVYALLQGYQIMTATQVSAITTGEAQPYGTAATGGTTEAVAPAETPAPAEGAPAVADPTSTAATAIPNLYTVPVTITITDSSQEQVLAYVAAMQRGPRLFLVTSVTGSDGVGDGAGRSATITAFMFVLADPTATADDATLALLKHGFDMGRYGVALGPVVDSGEAPSDEEDAPEPEPGATSTPTPTETPAP